MGVLQSLLGDLGLRKEAPGVGLSGVVNPPLTSPPFNPGVSGEGMPLPSSNEPITSPTDAPEEGFATVSGWAPTKRNIIGRLADAWLMAQGQKPIYEPRMKERDYKSAFKGFTNDPMETVRRLAQFDQESAIKLYNVVSDNERQKAAQRGLELMRQEKFRDNIGSMLGLFDDPRKTPEQKAELYRRTLPRIRQYAENRNIDVSELPDEYDPDAIQMWRMGGMTVDQQLDNRRADVNTESQINYRDVRLNQQQSEVNSRNANRTNQITNRDTRTNEYLRRGKTGGSGKTDDKYKARANKAFKGPNGSLVEFNKDGRGMKVTHPSGKVLWFKVGLDGKPVKVNPPKKDK